MTFEEFLEKVGGSRSEIITSATEKEALEAVKEDGYALRYVKEKP